MASSSTSLECVLYLEAYLEFAISARPSRAALQADGWYWEWVGLLSNCIVPFEKGFNVWRDRRVVVDRGFLALVFCGRR